MYLCITTIFIFLSRYEEILSPSVRRLWASAVLYTLPPPPPPPPSPPLYLDLQLHHCTGTGSIAGKNDYFVIFLTQHLVFSALCSLHELDCGNVWRELEQQPAIISDWNLVDEGGRAGEREGGVRGLKVDLLQVRGLSSLATSWLQAGLVAGWLGLLSSLPYYPVLVL